MNSDDSPQEKTQHVLEGLLEQSRGVIGRYPEVGEQFVFEFGRVKPRTIHMVGVRKPLEVQFFVDGELERSDVLRPWTGVARARCDRVVEQRPGGVS